MNLFELDIDDSFDFFCPVTGAQILGPDLWSRFCERLRKEHPNLLVFGFTSHGMACGPVSNTIYVAIDFAFATEDEGAGEDE